MRRTTALLPLLILFCGCAQHHDVTITPNHVAEITLTAAKPHADPFNELQLDAIVTTPSGQTLRVPAFWSGGPTWRFRYASPERGLHEFRTECSDPTDSGLQAITGTIHVKESELDPNSLYAHGPVRVAADRRHFEHADGTPFFWLGDTWWMGLCQRLRWPDDFQALTRDRREKGFTVVQIVAGLYPDMPAFDPRGANEAGFPWEQDYARINPAYFDAVDRRIAWLCDNGISPCIVAAWGYHLPWLGVERMKQHWRYLVARYGAYSVFWCVAGEGAMPYYLSKNKEQDVAFQKKGWTEVAAYLKAIDPYHHPLSIHPTDAARTQLLDPNLLDFDMLQTGHSDRKSIPRTLQLVNASVAATQPVMPTINAEVCYEGILNTCPADVVRLMAWACVLSGAAGHTYGANGIWQVNVAGHPYGKSPHGGDWGQTPWDQAMRLPGSAQVALVRKVLSQYDWPSFRPHAEWVAYDDKSKEHWGPFCSGIDGKVRVIYFPSTDAAHLRALSRGAYAARWVSPVDGQSLDADELRPAADGTCPVPPYPPDWKDAVLVVETRDMAPVAADFLPGVQRILFLGDSITYSGQYIDDLDTALRLHLPDRHFEIINCGLPSETLSGLSEPGHAGGQFPRPDLHERLDRVLSQTKPDLVIACYGMNDGIYLPLDDARFQKFKNGMTRLHDKVTATSARIVNLTPPVFDALPIKSRVAAADRLDADHPYERYDDVLDAYSKWLLSQRQAAGWTVIDLHGPMKQAIAEHRKSHPDFTFSGDGVHPNDDGHRLIATTLLRGLAVPFDPGAADFGDPADPSSLYSHVHQFVHERNHLLTDAWLTATGHKRPMPKGLPLAEAKATADAIDEQIRGAMHSQ